MKHPIGSTSNDIPVYVDLIKSRAALHIAEQPYLVKIVQEALGKIKVSGPDARIEHDMGRAIGYDFVVKTAENDSVLYACLVKESTFTRFVKNGKPTPTQYLTIILQRDDGGSYELCDTWVGRLSPPRPGTEGETADSKLFWEGHAFVLDNQPLQWRTLTKVCPY